MTLKELVLNYLEGRDWVAGGTLEREEFITERNGRFKPSTVGRTCRLLAEENKIEVRHEKGYVEYRKGISKLHPIFEQILNPYDEKTLQKMEIAKKQPSLI